MRWRARLTWQSHFFAEAKAKAQAAKSIPNLPQYMLQRLNRVVWDIERLNYVKKSIESVRDNIPDGAIEAERELAKHGNQQSLI